MESQQTRHCDNVKHRGRAAGPLTDSEGGHIPQQTIQSDDVETERTLDNRLRQHPDPQIDQRRFSKAEHEASARRYPPALVATGVRHEKSVVSMESDKRNDCRWTHKGPAEAEV